MCMQDAMRCITAVRIFADFQSENYFFFTLLLPHNSHKRSDVFRFSPLVFYPVYSKKIRKLLKIWKFIQIFTIDLDVPNEDFNKFRSVTSWPFRIPLHVVNSLPVTSFLMTLGMCLKRGLCIRIRILLEYATSRSVCIPRYFYFAPPTTELCRRHRLATPCIVWESTAPGLLSVLRRQLRVSDYSSKHHVMQWPKFVRWCEVSWKCYICYGCLCRSEGDLLYDSPKCSFSVQWTVLVLLCWALSWFLRCSWSGSIACWRLF